MCVCVCVCVCVTTNKQQCLFATYSYMKNILNQYRATWVFINFVLFVPSALFTIRRDILVRNARKWYQLNKIFTNRLIDVYIPPSSKHKNRSEALKELYSTSVSSRQPTQMLFSSWHHPERRLQSPTLPPSWQLRPHHCDANACIQTDRWTHQTSSQMALFHCMVRHGTVRYGSLLGGFPLGTVPGTWYFFSTTSVEVPSEPYRYQNVTCKLCWSLNGRRKSSLLRHWTCDTRPSSTALPARFKSAQPAKDRTQLLFKQTHIFASTTK